MRLILFFDLPVTTASKLRDYTHFVKNLKLEGFQMLQWSVYIKLAITNAKADATVARLKKFLPKDGSIEVLIITEKQFGSIITLLGERSTTIIDNDERLIEL